MEEKRHEKNLYALAGCGSGETKLTGEDEAAVLAFKEVKTDAMPPST